MSLWAGLIAVVCSVVAMIGLTLTARKVGGVVGGLLKQLVLGIFFSVFLHACVEMAERLGFLGKRETGLAMSGLITVGSFFFIIAGIRAVRAFR